MHPIYIPSNDELTLALKMFLHIRCGVIHTKQSDTLPGYRSGFADRVRHMKKKKLAKIETENMPPTSEHV